jgi:hypothetical protein
LSWLHRSVIEVDGRRDIEGVDLANEACSHVEKVVGQI